MQIPLQVSNVLLYLNSLRWLNTAAGDGTGLKSQLLSTPSLPTQLMKDCTTPTGSTPPTFYEQQGGIFYVPQESEQWKSCETGPLVFRPYPRRLECLTIYRCYNKGSTFSSVISRPWVLVRPGLNPRPPARQTGAYPIELTGRRLTNLLVTFQTCSNYTFFREQVKCSSVRSGFSVECNVTLSLEAVEKEIRASAVWRLVEKLLRTKENVNLKKTIFFLNRSQPIRSKNWMFLTAKTETFHLSSKIPNNINRKKINPPCYSVLTSVCALIFTLFYVSIEFWQVFITIELEPAIFSETICLYLFVWLLKIVFCWRLLLLVIIIHKWVQINTT